MASFTANVGDDYIRQLEALGRDADRVARRALEESADILADTMRQNLEGLSEDIRTSGGKDYYFLTQNEFFAGVPSAEKETLLDHMVVSPTRIRQNGDYSVWIGFEGYDDVRTEAYPGGRPVPMLVNAIEHGTSQRPKQPFIKPAVRSTKDRVTARIQRIIEQETEKVVK